MMYAENAEEVRKKRKAILAKWRLKCRGVADSLKEAEERLFAWNQLIDKSWKLMSIGMREWAHSGQTQLPLG